MWKIRKRDLEDVDRLIELYIQYVAAGRWPDQSEAALLAFLTLAEKALADDTKGTPERLFAWLVKQARDWGTITQEDCARRRFPSEVRLEMFAAARKAVVRREDRAEAVAETLADRRIGFAPAAMVQCFLPQRPTGRRSWVSDHGRASLLVEAGRLRDPDPPHRWIERPLPCGAKARLILPYISGEAIRTGRPEIHLGASLRDAMARLGIPPTGPNGRVLAHQIANVAAAQILFAVWDDAGTHHRGGRVAKEVSLWAGDPDQPTFRPPTLTLGDEYFAAIQEHRVPLDLAHLARLARSPRRMDLYTWLSYRTARIQKGTRVVVPLAGIRALFAPDIMHSRNFRARLLRDLAAIADVYRGFNIEVDGDVLLLRRSPPPVPFRRTFTAT